MHELSLAQNIVEIIKKFVPKEEWNRVRAVRTIVGEHSGVISDSLQFSYQAITASTILEQSHLEIESIPFMIHCSTCGKDSCTEMGNRQCVSCGSFNTNILAGIELTVREIEIADELLELV